MDTKWPTPYNKCTAHTGWSWFGWLMVSLYFLFLCVEYFFVYFQVGGFHPNTMETKFFCVWSHINYHIFHFKPHIILPMNINALLTQWNSNTVYCIRIQYTSIVSVSIRASNVLALNRFLFYTSSSFLFISIHSSINTNSCVRVSHSMRLCSYMYCTQCQLS